MIHVGFTEFRKRMAHFMDRALDDRDALLVTRQGSEPVVLIAQSEYEGMVETLHLMSSPANAERLLRSIEDADAGRNLVEVEWNEEAGMFKAL